MSKCASIKSQEVSGEHIWDDAHFTDCLDFLKPDSCLCCRLFALGLKVCGLPALAVGLDVLTYDSYITFCCWKNSVDMAKPNGQWFMRTFASGQLK